METYSNFSAHYAPVPSFIDNHNRYVILELREMGNVQNQRAFTLEQLEVIQQLPGNTVVYASPGSGKTTVLTYHISSLLLSGKMSPNQVMAITFTRQAASDLKRRLYQVPGLSARSVEAVQTGTFHAQIFRFLLRAEPNIPVLLRPTEQVHLLTQALRKTGLELNQIQKWQSFLTRAKSNWPITVAEKPVARLLKHYERLKESAHRWDFDDILLHFCDVYCAKGGKPLDTGVQYLLVDEFQDTNPVQSKILQYFSKTHSIPVFAVGDDDQAIYGFRGASPHWLLNFPIDFSPSNKFHLSENFRSDRSIVQHAASLIHNNQQRTRKYVRIASEQEGHCSAWLHQTEEMEARKLFELLYNRQVRQQSVAVLARTRRQLLLVWQLVHNAVPNLQYRTFHDAKGKEWDEVHLLGCIESNPYLADFDEVDREEERRLMYVAMTRARHRLYLHAPLHVMGRRVVPSQFLHEAKCI